ncbi:BrnT family toxin [candidate division WWE3 bacterium]|nr:BrnT family toxin [candidate division WWE3 bacterium]
MITENKDIVLPAPLDFDWDIGIGNTGIGRLLFIVFTLRGRKVRVISARDSNKKERKLYEKIP